MRETKTSFVTDTLESKVREFPLLCRVNGGSITSIRSNTFPWRKTTAPLLNSQLDQCVLFISAIGNLRHRAAHVLRELQSLMRWFRSSKTISVLHYKCFARRFVKMRSDRKIRFKSLGSESRFRQSNASEVSWHAEVMENLRASKRILLTQCISRYAYVRISLVGRYAVWAEKKGDTRLGDTGFEKSVCTFPQEYVWNHLETHQKSLEIKFSDQKYRLAAPAAR